MIGTDPSEPATLPTHPLDPRNSPMPSRTVTIASKVGLHARPAAVFVRAVVDRGSPVTIAKGDGVPVDARSILMVMGLGVGCGDEVTISSDGDGAEAVLDELAQILVTDHDE